MNKQAFGVGLISFVVDVDFDILRSPFSRYANKQQDSDIRMAFTDNPNGCL